MGSEYRIERDTMGEVQVPAAAYYGAQTARARANFAISGVGLPRVIIRALGILKGAAAAVNLELGALEERMAAAIRQAASEVAAGDLDAHFVVDVFQTGSGTSSHMNANEVIANRAAEILGHALGSRAVHPNDHVNRGQSSNDVFPSAVHLGLALVLHEQLLPQMTELETALHGIADRTFGDIKTGRTHLMDAMPIRFGQEFRGYAGQVERCRKRIAEAWTGLLEVPLGGTAVGTGVNAPPGFAAAVLARVAREHGIPLRETENHLQAQASLDAVVHASGALRTFATALYKIANDIRWMSSGPLCGLGELSLPAVQPGSSIMPAKVNPVICESVLMVCAQVLALDAAIAFGNSQGQLELNTMMPLIGRNAVDGAQMLANACAALRTRCLAGLEVRAESKERVQRNPILATALAPLIGYEAAAQIAKAAAASGRTVREVAAAQTSLSAEQLDRALDPAALCGEWGAPAARGRPG
jgi:fumarate hydratase class II